MASDDESSIDAIAELPPLSLPLIAPQVTCDLRERGGGGADAVST
jgi:hypothetical protein